jgi:hypothetical protein
MSNTKEQETKPAPKMPFWVLLAFSSIQKRKHALILIWSCILFSVYCLPWVQFINSDVVAKLFLIDDWSWIAMMLPLSLWYILSLRWMDTNNAWEQPS